MNERDWPKVCSPEMSIDLIRDAKKITVTSKNCIHNHPKRRPSFLNGRYCQIQEHLIIPSAQICLPTYLPTYLHTYLPALQPFDGPWSPFQFLKPIHRR